MARVSEIYSCSYLMTRVAVSALWVRIGPRRSKYAAYKHYGLTLRPTRLNTILDNAQVNLDSPMLIS